MLEGEGVGSSGWLVKMFTQYFSGSEILASIISGCSKLLLFFWLFFFSNKMHVFCLEGQVSYRLLSTGHCCTGI